MLQLALKNVFQCEATFSLAGRVGWIKSRAKGRRSKKSLASANVICEGPPQTFKMVTSNGNDQFQGTGQEGGRPPSLILEIYVNHEITLFFHL